MSESIEFYDFSRPLDGEHLTGMTRLVYAIGTIASGAVQVERTLCNHPDGRAENDPEHSHMVNTRIERFSRDYPDQEAVLDIYAELAEFMQDKTWPGTVLD